MLIDFSDLLSCNMYELGACFLALLKRLHWHEQPALTKPVDPSLFLNRFVDKFKLPSTELRTVRRVAGSRWRAWSCARCVGWGG